MILAEAVQPLDVIGSVVLPVGAILVSAGIAIWLARGERRASERSQTRVEVVELIRTLTDLERTAARGETDAARAASARFSSTLNAFTAHLSRADVAVPRYLAIVMNRAIETGDLAAISRVALFLATCLDAWLRGTVTTREFAVNTPDDVNGVWDERVDPSAWRAVIDDAP